MKKSKWILIDISIIAFILVSIFSEVIPKEINNLDEIWNYNFAKNIADGLVPYKDFNIITTPLLPMLCGIFLKIFANELIVMRILEVILLTAIFYTSYKILEILTKNKIISVIAIILNIYMFKDIFAIDYNYANLLIALILTLIELKNLEKTKGEILIYNSKRDFLIGIIAGISILFKQTTGICITLACIGYKIFAIQKKENIKEFIKIAITRLSGAIIPVIIMIIYLIANNALYEFIDYTILGVKTFSNVIPYKQLLENVWYIKILAIIIPVTIILMFLKVFHNKKDNKILILFAYGISSFVVTFPISDKIHFLTGSLITILAIVYIISKICLKPKNRIIAVLYSIFCGIIAIICFIQIWNSILNINKYIQSSKETKLKHYYGITEKEEFRENIIEIGNYIENKKTEGRKVYILDATAAIYMIPLDIYNKDYDMFNKGNLGKNGEQGIIDRIKSEEQAIYLIKNDKYSRNWQNPETVRKYIQENLKKTGEIYIFDIYE